MLYAAPLRAHGSWRLAASLSASIVALAALPAHAQQAPIDTAAAPLDEV